MRDFSIGEVVQRTGVAEGTLRVWERRHGFPAPERLPSGHRRYSAADVSAISRVALERAAGAQLAEAIARAKRSLDPPTSVYGVLRRSHPELAVRTLPKRALLALTHALEEESIACAERPLLFGSFQREHFYRQDEPRWREFSRTAALSCVFADFARYASPQGGPSEIPITRERPLMREWVMVCDAPGYSACVAAWEPPHSAGGPILQRTFDSLWSVDPSVVRDAARACVELAGPRLPGVDGALRERLDAPAQAAAAAEVRLACAIAGRALEYML